MQFRAPPSARAGTERAWRWISRGFEELACLLDADPCGWPADQAQHNQAQHEPYYDIVIVGSGYGGAIAAAEFAGRRELAPQRAGTAESESPPVARVCVLERGLEYLPGMFPTNEADLPGHVRFSTEGHPSPRGKLEGLFDVRLGADVSAVLANGLGGGSLINAGVMEAATSDAWQSGAWPQELATPGEISDFYSKAAAMLGATLPNGEDNTIAGHACGAPLKHRAFQRFSQVDADKFRDARLSISMRPHTNQAGVELGGCLRCGDCAIGCNHGAKNSLDEGPLVQACNRGADIFTGATVLRLRKWEPTDAARKISGWELDIVHTDAKLRQRRPQPFRLRARRVVLAAGTFGSTEILLRSASDSLQFSRRLGQSFSTNGDLIAVHHGCGQDVNAVANEAQEPAQRSIGPTITGLLDLRTSDGTCTIQEIAIPGALRRLFAESFTLAQLLHRMKSVDAAPHGAATSDPGAIDPCAIDDGQIDQSLAFGIMGHDGARGSMELVEPSGSASDAASNDGAIRIRWAALRDIPDHKPCGATPLPPGADEQVFDRELQQLRRLAAGSATPGILLPNPIWRLLPEELRGIFDMPTGPALTVHPLGGCCMGNDALRGVVDHLGRVFDAARGATQLHHEGLVVLDGSIIPSSLGINPALTIAAVALRAVVQLRQRWQLGEIVVRSARRGGKRPMFRELQYRQRQPTQVEVAERMSGVVNMRVDGKLTRRVVELTLQFAACELRELSAPRDRKLTVDPANSTVRIFDFERWQELRLKGETDKEFAEAALVIAPLSGHMQLLHREPSLYSQRRWRALHAWLLNRGVRALGRAAGRWFVKVLRGASHASSARARSTEQGSGYRETLHALASHAGEIRRFDYHLTIGTPSRNVPGIDVANRGIEGHKRLTYARKSNPWNQLMRMTVTRFAEHADASGMLELDLKYLAQRSVPLLRIASQDNQATALFDLISFGLYFVRLLLWIHAWSFRIPDRSSLREPQRLPGRLPGLPEPEIKELPVDELPDGSTVRVRLTRYRRVDSQHPPVALIHGYSTSGTTFAHPAVKPNLASFLWKQGRDVWVIDLRTSCGMPTAKQPWTFEQPAHADIPVALDHIANVTGCSKLDVVAHCMGAAMMTMAVLGPPPVGARFFAERQRLPTLVRALVMSQVAPVVTFSPANVFRAYIVGYLRDIFTAADFDFRPVRAPTAGDQLIDYLLATTPYPDEEYTRENPLWPWQSTSFARTRHRMDALYGRDFNLNNMPRSVLAHIDDLFGPLSLGTVFNAIHFARNNRVTDSFGYNSFVKRGRLRRYWKDIATLSIHGAANGLADVSTVHVTEQAMKDAQVEVYRTFVKSGYGHQDCLIGRDARSVFQQIEKFLRNPAGYRSGDAEYLRSIRTAARDSTSATAPAQSQLAAKDLLARSPWLGPLKGPSDGRRLEVALGFDPQIGRPTDIIYAAVVSDGNPAGKNNTYGIEPFSNGDTFRALPWPNDFNEPLVRIHLDSNQWSQPPSEVLVLLIYDEPASMEAATASRDVASPPLISANILRAVDKYLQDRSQAEIAESCLRLQARPRPVNAAASAIPSVPRAQVTFSMGSCQYPAGMLDEHVAGASYRRLEELLHSTSNGRPSFMVLMGDQIYSDATAGLFDPAMRSDRYVLPHIKWLRTPAVRGVLRSIPAYTMLDDHEIEDNWEPLEASDAEQRDIFAAARAAYLQFQRPWGPKPGPGDSLWYARNLGGLEFFFADTRTDRTRRDIAALEQARIIGAASVNACQFAALRTWLGKHSATDEPKFIISPSILLPRRMRASYSPAGAILTDSWAGFPSSLRELLAIVTRTGARNLVFLSGDEHHSCIARITLIAHGVDQRPVIVHSIHCSALYAPFPFANGAPADLLERDCFDFADAAGQRYTCEVVTDFIPPGDGFGVLDCQQEPSGWRCRYRFHRSDVTYVGVLS